MYKPSGSYCARSEPVVSESCSLKSREVSIHTGAPHFFLLVLVITLAANVLVAIIAYCLFNIRLHIYSLAGITVSLGIIIDSTIVMCDHYSYYHDRKVFPALFGATATTIAALCVVYLLPEADRKNLDDFSKVIIINLSVALVTSYAFVPSLLDRFPIRRSRTVAKARRSRMTIRFNRAYSRYIGFGQRHKWLPTVIFIIGFGIPLCLLPDQRLRMEETMPYITELFAFIADNREIASALLGPFGLFPLYVLFLLTTNFLIVPY